MESVYSQKNECCGCGLCELVCPTKAINMEKDACGFPYPVIHPILCTDCMICVNTCPQKSGYDYHTNAPQVYAVKHKNKDIRRHSTSGGLFTAVSDYVLDCGGVVFGVAYDGQQQAVHKAAYTKKERDEFRGSKYVKSALGDTFKQVDTLLKQNKQVLFTGTPCQVAALRKYIGQQDRLLTMDFVCHGTPSQKTLDDYIAYVEKKQGKKIRQHMHRIKDFGWHGHIEANIFADGKKDCKSFYAQLYKILFYSHLNLNLNCYSCRYTNFMRPSDLTMGDFWGIERCLPDFDDNKGISLLLVNNKAGERVFDAIKDTLHFRVSTMDDCSVHQCNLKQPSIQNKRYEKFNKDYRQKGFSYVALKYAYPVYCLQVLKRTVKKILSIIEGR